MCIDSKVAPEEQAEGLVERGGVGFCAPGLAVQSPGLLPQTNPAKLVEPLLAFAHFSPCNGAK